MKKFTKKGIIITSIVSILSIGLGTGVGLYFGQEFLTNKTNYDALDADNLEDDNKALYQKYLKMNDYSSLESYQLVNISLYKLSTLDYFSSIEEGEAVASGITQTINGKNIKNKSSYFNESISNSSLVHIAKRFYQNDDEIDEYTGNVKSATSAEYKEDSKSISTLNEFENKWGKTLDRPCIYIISSKTVVSSSVDFYDNQYKISLELNPSTSVIRYVKQMKSMSQLSSYPEFSKVKLTFTLDSKLTLLEFETDETYEVFKFGKHNTNGKLKTTYFYDLEEKMPSLNEEGIKEK